MGLAICGSTSLAGDSNNAKIGEPAEADRVEREREPGGAGSTIYTLVLETGDGYGLFHEITSQWALELEPSISVCF